MLPVIMYFKKLRKPAMPSKILYDDKLVFVTDFMSKMPNKKQVEMMEEIPDEWTMQKRVDYLYDQVRKIMERNNPGLRSDQSEPTLSDALCPTK